MKDSDRRLIMVNARRLIKAPKKTLNCSLYAELFGTGMTTAMKMCAKIGLDPYSNETKLNED